MRGRVVLLAAVVGLVAGMGAVAEGAAAPYSMAQIFVNGADTFYPTGINNAGTVVGYGETYNGGWTYQVMSWRGGQSSTGILGKGWGINEAGVVAGEGKDGANYGGFYSSVSAGRTSLAGMGMYRAGGIANNGLVAGETSMGTAVLTYKPGEATVKDFGRPEGSNVVEVAGINSAGLVIGVATKYADAEGEGGWSRGFVIGTEPQPGPVPGAFVPTFALLPGFNGSEAATWANDVNERGMVVGGAGGRAVLWRTQAEVPTGGGAGGFTLTPVSLGSLVPGSDVGAGEARGINERNQVVGFSFSPAGRRGFLWNNGRMVDLNSLVPAGSGFTIREGVAINDKGQVVAIGRYDGENQNVVMFLEPNYGASQEVALRPTVVEEVGGTVIGHFEGVASGLWFDPEPTGHVHVEMEGAGSLFTEILELPYGFGEMTVSVEGVLLGTYEAGEAVDLGGVREFDVTWGGESIYADFPLKLAFDTGVASFRIESVMVVPEPGAGVMFGAVAVMAGGRRRRA